MAQRGRPRNFDRDEALGQAVHLFWERGYDGTSIANLKEALSLNSPSIYAAFGSKEELFREAIQRYLETDGATITQALEAAPTGVDAARAMLLTSAREFSRKDRPRGCMVVLEALHSHDSNGAVNAALTTLRDQNLDRLAAKFDADVAAGRLPPQTDGHAIAAFFVTVQQGMAIRARDGADAGALESVAECALAAWPALTQSRPARAKT